MNKPITDTSKTSPKDYLLDEIVTAICLRNGDAYDKSLVIFDVAQKYFQAQPTEKDS